MFVGYVILIVLLFCIFIFLLLNVIFIVVLLLFFILVGDIVKFVIFVDEIFCVVNVLFLLNKGVMIFNNIIKIINFNMFLFIKIFFYILCYIYRILMINYKLI